MQKSWRIRQEHTSIASQEETPMKSLTEFIPKIESHRNLNQNHFGSFLQFKKNDRDGAIFKSFETDTENNTETKCWDLVTHYPNYTDAELIRLIF